ncbi:hypothetical protein DMN91_010019 [Ooceraea biroi]|uniref:Survival motor neuron protein n=1 Tax=Ooceraea biroi TaxID=2015173 RepID=A0A026WVT6_OOCBI|nr:survival motor neuron protein [Ooceraea biroi]EZA60117.1 Survival motor neuron protein [Ooceraea biroi]RLU17782.1 hypothetical protein DMN91_010019 [Ooceraea biroi]
MDQSCADDMTEESNVLFVRGSEDKSGDDDIWDDTILIQAYDRAVSLAKEEVAKRIAMNTQSEHTKQKAQGSKRFSKISKKWTVGSPCRAVYSVDGETYEAIISKIFENSGMCLVKFIGYQNIEKVKLDSLLESEGLQSQIAQQKVALAAEKNSEDTDSDRYSIGWNSTKINVEKMDCDTEDSKLFKKNFTRRPGHFDPANIMPPAPPLPPQLMAKLPESDTEALSSMLMSWYISGFHTGYYHGLKQANINHQKRRNC